MSNSIEAMLKRQRVLADFGDLAVQSHNLDQVLHEACRLVAEALGTSRAKVLEIEPGGQSLLVRAGVGWDPGIVGHLRLPMAEHSSETHSIRAGVPIISQDIRTETRFELPAFLKDAGVVALVSVPVFLPGRRAYGFLQVDATEPRDGGTKPTGGQWLGIGAAFTGAALAIGPTFARGFDPVGVGLAFASGLTFALYAAARSRGQERHDVIGPSLGLMAVLVMSLHLAFETTPSLAWSHLLAIAAIEVGPLTLLNALWDLASRMDQVATISGLAYHTPLFALLLLTLLGAAEVSWLTAAGAGMIVVGALVASRTKLPNP